MIGSNEMGSNLNDGTGSILLFLQLQFSVIDKNGKKILFRKGELKDWLNSSKHEQDENIHQAASRYV